MFIGLLFLLTLAFFSRANPTDTEYDRCASIVKPNIPDAKVLSVSSIKRYNATIPAQLFLDNTITGLNFCEVNVTLTRINHTEPINFSVWIPLKGWNRRFQATGGGGFQTGYLYGLLGVAVEQGYVVATTDGGHTLDEVDVSSWALNKDGSINQDLLYYFAIWSLHTMAIVGKEITYQYFRVKPDYSYWNGCSTGGRQGYMIAQNYPEDFDGILANAPAIQFTTILVGDVWAQVVMRDEGHFLSACERDYFIQLALSQCDENDGVLDGIINDPISCKFDPTKALGLTINCTNPPGSTQITNTTVRVIQRIYQGPITPFGHRLWYGFPASTNISDTAYSVIFKGVTIPVPFPISTSSIQALFLQDPAFDMSQITVSTYPWLLGQSLTQFGWELSSSDPNLHAFHAAGGKLLTWHGLNDQLIPVENTMEYHQRVELEMGSSVVDQFYRLFLPPGVAHCYGGVGPIPTDPLNALVQWVEKKKAPETIPAFTNVSGYPISRNICRYPYQPHYSGGDPNVPRSWTCEKADPPKFAKLGTRV